MKRIAPWIVGYLLFACLFGFGWLGGALLLGNILLHELGHAWAMRRYGMRVEEIRFNPLLGAAVVTTSGFPSHHATAFISLMGPVWGGAMAGVTLSLALLFKQDWLLICAEVMTAINLLNLLPLSVLDGGRVWRALAFSVTPAGKIRLQVITTAVSLSIIVLLASRFLPQIIVCGVVWLWYVHTNYQALRQHTQHETLAGILGVTCERGAIDASLTYLVEMLRTENPATVTGHKIFTFEPFKSCVSELTRQSPSAKPPRDWEPLEWKNLYIQAYNLGMERCQMVTTASPTWREYLHLLFYADGRHLSPMSQAQTRLCAVAFLGTALTLTLMEIICLRGGF